MAALTDAMKWYNLGGLKAARTKYHFKVEFFSSKYIDAAGGRIALQPSARLIFDTVRTVELPKYSIETEVVNAWNVRQLVPTKIVFEPISISFTDTLDNRFQKFIKNYLNIISGSFAEQTKTLRKEYDNFGLKLLEANEDCPIDKIEITRFYEADNDRNELFNKSKTTLWRPKIIDIQHDTLDYSASEAVTWQISLRYESVTYEEDNTEAPGITPQPQAEPPVRPVARPPVSIPAPPTPSALGQYIIKPGDQLGYIAQRYGNTVKEILDVNKDTNFKKPLIPGQVINLPNAGIVGAGSVWKEYPGGVYGDKPIVDSNDPKVIKQALSNLDSERQALLRKQALLESPTGDMKSWSAQRLQSTKDEVERSLRLNAAMTNRGELQLTRANDRLDPNGETKRLLSRFPRTGEGP